jgi:hypothetical protein
MERIPAEAMKQFAIRLYFYIIQAWKSSRDRRTGQSFGRMLNLFPSWNRSLRLTPTEAKIPWLTYAAIELLEQVLRPEMRVFEWGVGGSTLFFSSRVGQVVSVEHDLGWAEKVRALMSSSNSSWQLFVAPPLPRENEGPVSAEDPKCYASTVDGYSALSFRHYATIIDDFPDGFFDVILVDGRSRVACTLHAISKIGPSGYLLVDDAERPRYAWIHREMRRVGWKSFNLAGPAPCEWTFRQTGCWQRSSF